jgi:hypothetical protein
LPDGLPAWNERARTGNTPKAARQAIGPGPLELVSAHGVAVQAWSAAAVAGRETVVAVALKG